MSIPGCHKKWLWSSRPFGVQHRVWSVIWTVFNFIYLCVFFLFLSVCILDCALLHDNTRNFAGGLFATRRLSPDPFCPTYRFPLLVVGNVVWLTKKINNLCSAMSKLTPRRIYALDCIQKRNIVTNHGKILGNSHRPRKYIAHVWPIFRNIIHMINVVLFKVFQSMFIIMTKTNIFPMWWLEWPRLHHQLYNQVKNIIPDYVPGNNFNIPSANLCYFCFESMENCRNARSVLHGF